MSVRNRSTSRGLARAEVNPMQLNSYTRGVQESVDLVRDLLLSYENSPKVM